MSRLTTSRRRWQVPALVGLVVCSGCSTGNAEPAPAPPPERVVQGSIPLQQELSIGSLEGQESTFGAITDVAVGPDGQVAVADGMTRTISMFSGEGRFLGRLMGRGEGPGEAGSISDITIGRGGDVWVYDASLRRVTHLSMEGALRATHPVRSGFHEPNVLAASDDGRVFGRFLALRNAMLPTGLRSEWFDVGSLEPRVTAPPRDPVGPDFSLFTNEGERLTPFQVQYLSDLGPDGCLYAIRSDRYRVMRDCGQGDEVLIDLADEMPLPVTAAEREEWEAVSELLTAFSVRMGDGDPRYPAIPVQKPFVRQLVVDSDGRIWLQRHTPSTVYPYAPGEAEERAAQGRSIIKNRSENRWDVFAPDGEFLGDIVLPMRARFTDARGDLIAGVVMAADDIPRAVLWRMLIGGDQRRGFISADSEEDN